METNQIQAKSGATVLADILVMAGKEKMGTKDKFWVWAIDEWIWLGWGQVVCEELIYQELGLSHNNLKLLIRHLAGMSDR